MRLWTWPPLLSYLLTGLGSLLPRSQLLMHTHQHVGDKPVGLQVREYINTLFSSNMTTIGTASTLLMNASSRVGWHCEPSTKRALVLHACPEAGMGIPLASMNNCSSGPNCISLTVMECKGG